MIQTAKLTTEGGYTVTTVDGVVLHVPNDPANRHFQEVQEWIADGNTPDPADPPPVFDKTAASLSGEEIEALIVSKVVATRAEIDAIKAAR